MGRRAHGSGNGVPHAARRVVRRRPRRGRAARRVRSDGRPASGARHRRRGERRRAPAGPRRATVRDCRRPDRSRPADPGGERAAVRPGEGAARPVHARAGGGAAASAAVRRPPSGLRRHLQGHPGTRPRRGLQIRVPDAAAAHLAGARGGRAGGGRRVLGRTRAGRGHAAGAAAHRAAVRARRADRRRARPRADPLGAQGRGGDRRLDLRGAAGRRARAAVPVRRGARGGRRRRHHPRPRDPRPHRRVRQRAARALPAGRRADLPRVRRRAARRAARGVPVPPGAAETSGTARLDQLSQAGARPRLPRPDGHRGPHDVRGRRAEPAAPADRGRPRRACPVRALRPGGRGPRRRGPLRRRPARPAAPRRRRSRHVPGRAGRHAGGAGAADARRVERHRGRLPRRCDAAEPVRRAGAGPSRRVRRHLRRQDAHVRRAGRGGRAAGRQDQAGRGRARRAGRRAPAPLRPAAGEPARRAQGGSRVPAARPRPPGGTARHDRGRRPSRAGAVRDGRAALAGDAGGPRVPGDGGAARGAGTTRRLGLRDLHLGLDGPAEGVEVDHGNLANLLLAMRDRLESGPADAWLALTSPAFDISALELYLPLITGGRVVVAPHGAVRQPEALARLVAEQGVTHVQATPSVWRLLLPGGLAGVTALTGGEALPPRLAQELRERFPRVVNVYGPTETTIWSTYGEPGDGDVVTIGRPLANTRIYLLDEALRPVPQGVAGELCIGGAGVARGYRGRPALTAERFVPDPFGPPGARLYRTGDMARYRDDGEIEFLGRRDGQVKLLGHRIELGEIEARLREHPQVGEAAVVVRGEGTDDHRLIAYVVPAQGEPDAGDLAAHLARTLPAATLPSAYVLLDALPLNPIGKLDRAALPEPPRTTEPPQRTELAQQAESAQQAAPPGSGGGALVEEVRRIWCEVLELDDVGIDDDLFDLGGHSLTITQISARIRESLGVDVSLDAFFDDPTIQGVVEEIVRLQGDRPAAEIRPRPEGVVPPLSFVQERLWFLQKFDPDDASYNMYLVLRLRGELDTGALQEALDAVVARHESLRTSFADVDGAPITVIHPPGPVTVERIDLAGSPGAESEALRLVAERTNAPFDLAQAPPLRISLLRLGPGDHVLCFVLHHIIADGTSLGILFDDLFALYQDRDAELPPLRIQYGDVALWQREQDSEESLAYWRDQLADPPVLDLPADLPGGERPEGAFHTFTVPAELVTRLERIAQEHNASLFMVLVAAYQVLLARHTGQDDILVGTPWATRDRMELEPVIGYLTDTLVLRGDLSGDPLFAELLDATRRTVLDAHAHRTVPFERLIGELGVPRDLNRNPLLSTMIILHSQAGEGTPPERVGDLGVELFDGGYRQAKFELSLEFWRNERGLLAVFGYDATRYRADTVEGLAARLETLLQGIADAPETPISRLPLLTEADTALLTASRSAVPGDGESVPALIRRAMAAHPDATALLWGGEAMSYAQLDAKVARLAAALRRRGVADGCVVGVCLERSAEAIVALLAVWRAGGAYLPLDPAYPDERLAFLIADSAARLVVTDAGLASRLPGETVVLVAGDETGPGDSHWYGDWDPVEPDDPAYVIYTSGSTGRPKGVLVEHGSLAARVHWMRQAYEIGPDDRVAQFASLSFDAHAEELYPALTAGASVLLLPDGAASLPDVLRTPACRQVSVLDLPTAYWHRLTEALGDVTWPEPLRLVILGGEQVHAAAVARWRERFGDRVRLINTYGPTEGTIIATAHDLGAADTVGRPPIGRPIAGTTAHVLGPYGEPVPPGCPGELCLGGAGLARGYLGRPALTADRFVPDPFGPPGSRLYRTGDRVRWRRDGTLEFLGRFDAQVKVRGFRVEPGEVEAVLLAQPGVRQAVVTADGERLAAYVAGPAEPDELRARLAAALPAHLVPTAWVSLPELPLTITGKVDVAALPAPEPGPAAEYVAPRTDAEVLVAEVWRELLGLETVGAHDDFFALGGHSLLATRVAALLRNAVETEVPIRTVFDHPTVAGLAAAVERLVIEQLSALSDAEAAELLEVGE
ncbi:amino acid adenylation domain-containing protein [Nonomuraea sp. N2-4H]